LAGISTTHYPEQDAFEPNKITNTQQTMFGVCYLGPIKSVTGH